MKHMSTIMVFIALMFSYFAVLVGILFLCAGHFVVVAVAMIILGTPLAILSNFMMGLVGEYNRIERVAFKIANKAAKQWAKACTGQEWRDE